MDKMTRKATIRASNEETKSLTFVMISRENTCKRFDWNNGRYYNETLDINGARFDELKTMFKDHEPSVDNAIARVENIREEDGELLCDAVFASDDDSQKIYKKYIDGVLSDVSIGYSIKEQKREKGEDSIDEVLVTDFSILELSAVWKGADKGAKKREEEQMAQMKQSAYYETQKRKLNLKEKEIVL
ncbi:HK97 family phage prohead protease [Campylobacter sp. RM16190]|uniref:HK97 family phage prohead protease n=1 Tax=Campylobacter sp. RM16190 TaxID=1705727 RepID=UPI001475323C|nr:HK97 family phage prohead protease [Campylobacter sp. RM16190]